MTASALARNGGPGHLISSTPSPPIQSPGHPSKNATDAPLPAQIRPQIRQRNPFFMRRRIPRHDKRRGLQNYALGQGRGGLRRGRGGHANQDSRRLFRSDKMRRSRRSILAAFFIGSILERITPVVHSSRNLPAHVGPVYSQNR